MRTVHFRSFAAATAIFLGLALGFAGTSVWAQDKKSDVTIGQKGEAPDVRKQNYAASIDWYNGITSEIFG